MVNSGTAYLYLHRRRTDGRPFYIGISKGSPVGTPRLLDFHKRSVLWKRIAKKHGVICDILAMGVSFDYAKVLEKQYIELYGRLNIGTGVLANLTDGGDGCSGFTPTEEHRKKISEALKGHPGMSGKDNPFFGKTHSKESRLKMSKGQKRLYENGYTNPNLGKKLPQWQKDLLCRVRPQHTDESRSKISKALKGRAKPKAWVDAMSGDNNHMRKNRHKYTLSNNNNAKPCVHILSGEEFGSLKEACQKLGVSYNTQRKYLKELRNNRKFNWK